MAKFISNVFADIRNRQNGIVYSRNRFGGYIRNMTVPINPQTPRQQEERGLLAALSSAWKALTQAQRDGWNAGAANYPFVDVFGNARTYSGEQLFIKLNRNLQQLSIGQLSDVPVSQAVPAISSLTLTAVAGPSSLSLAYVPTPVPANTGMQIFATPPISPGISFAKNRFRVVATRAAAAASPFDMLAAYEAVFGLIAPQQGQKILVRAFLISTVSGQAGVLQETSDIIA